MADDAMRDDRTERDERDERIERSEHGGRDRAGGGHETEPYPGDPREAQEPQEPRSAHVSEGRQGAPHEEPGRGRDQNVVDQLREVWDRMRGKD